MEKALKAFLSFHDGLTAEQAKSQFGHDLNKLIAEVIRLHPSSRVAAIHLELSAFVPHSDRYSGRVFPSHELWQVYRIAQFTAAELIRSITGRNLITLVQMQI